MKICKFCGAENKDVSSFCTSCGGHELQYKCNNCGSVFSEVMHCPHCGIKAGQQARVCPQCNTKYFTAACSTCGYLPGKVNNFIVNTVPAPVIIPTSPHSILSCPRCHSTYVKIQAVNHVQIRNKRHGAAWWVFVGWWWMAIKWTYLLIPTLLIKLFKSKKQVAVNTTQSVAVCQSCGYNWKK